MPRICVTVTIDVMSCINRTIHASQGSVMHDLSIGLLLIHTSSHMNNLLTTLTQISHIHVSPHSLAGKKPSDNNLPRTTAPEWHR